MTPGGDTSTGADHYERVVEAASQLDPRVQSVTYPTVYGGSKRGILFRVGGERILVVPKWQAVGGTVDEKFPFVLESVAVAGFDRVFIVAGGGGAGGGAMRWLHQAAARYPHVSVLDSAEDFRGAIQRYQAYGDWS